VHPCIGGSTTLFPGKDFTSILRDKFREKCFFLKLNYYTTSRTSTEKREEKTRNVKRGKKKKKVTKEIYIG